MAPYDSDLDSVAVESGLKAGFHDASGCTADISQCVQVDGDCVSGVSSAYRSALGSLATFLFDLLLIVRSVIHPSPYRDTVLERVEYL